MIKNTEKTNPVNCSILLWLAVFLGAILRLYKLGSHNLWFDEVHTFAVLNIYFEKLSLYGLFSFMSLLNHHLYYVFLKLWTIYFGKSEFALRSLSMVFGVLSIPLIYKLGRSFFNTKVGLVSAFILAISPMHIWYSQEARGYSLSTFLVMLVANFFILVIEKNKIYLWIGLVVSSILAVCSNYFCFYMIVIVNALFFLKSNRHLLKRWILSLFFILVVFFPLLPLFVRQIIRVKNNFWIPKPCFSSIVITLENFNLGYNAMGDIYFFSFLVFSSLFLFGIWRWWQEKSRVLVFLILFLLVPVIFTFLISQIVPIYLDRQLMLFSPFYYIIIACGLCKIKIRFVKVLVYFFISAATAMCICNYFSYYIPAGLSYHIGAPVKKPVKPAADYINKRFTEGDAIGFSDPHSFALTYYLRKLILKKNIKVFSFVIKSKLDSYWKGFGDNRKYGIYFRGGMPFRNSRDISVVILDDEISRKKFKKNTFKKLWLISSSWARSSILDVHPEAVRQWMRMHYSLLESREFDGIFVDIYYSSLI